MEDSAKQEILEAIHAFADQVDRRFERIESDIGVMKGGISSLKTDVSSLKTDVSSLKTDVSSLKSDASSLKTDVSSLKIDVGYLKSQMVTKDYLDRKIANLRGELVVLTRKENVKLSTLVEELITEGSLSRKTGDFILEMEPFAHA